MQPAISPGAHRSLSGGGALAGECRIAHCKRQSQYSQARPFSSVEERIIERELQAINPGDVLRVALNLDQGLGVRGTERADE
ncbi:hypothetical protein IFT96_02255 [Pseudomonas fluorescens]|uniref:Uncharacterized protein n=1 Tax=Pseudomonas fluorescens TaxID=294 RepID=A0A4Y9TNR5_PSEFL|nr:MULTISPECIES: hypothetical protein [Pseudomonas]MBD8254180.1 hypothetical protein [Pseudomonas fluorescens]MBD8269129.1 hypothetical protein [Pseudomonas fluorescens]MBH3398018.1 hypothetical protein [Pseudomonas fluorescens]MDV3056487.1 hypothetical protein [Pseudomonas paracarnis]NJJ56005.1 hypothetical protein [Pseudomonas sp. B14(2022)]